MASIALSSRPNPTPYGRPDCCGPFRPVQFLCKARQFPRFFRLSLPPQYSRVRLIEADGGLSSPPSAVNTRCGSGPAPAALPPLAVLQCLSKGRGPIGFRLPASSCRPPAPAGSEHNAALWKWPRFGWRDYSPRADCTQGNFRHGRIPCCSRTISGHPKRQTSGQNQLAKDPDAAHDENNPWPARSSDSSCLAASSPRYISATGIASGRSPKPCKAFAGSASASSG